MRCESSMLPSRPLLLQYSFLWELCSRRLYIRTGLVGMWTWILFVGAVRFVFGVGLC